jgi:hypothetical protein
MTAEDIDFVRMARLSNSSRAIPKHNLRDHSACGWSRSFKSAHWPDFVLTLVWPEDLIGTQSIDGAFDVIAFQSARHNETIAGEVKKTVAETTNLIVIMRNFGADAEAEEASSGPRRNAFKK